MKIQIASDLHLEFLERTFPGERLLRPAVDADVLVLAGDIANGISAIDLFKNWPVPVLYLAGNHEFYSHEMGALRASLRKASEGTRITFLDNDAVDFGGVRFVGTTLWTNYRLELNRTQRQLMEQAELRINDHRQIRFGQAYFTAQQALAQHEVAHAWLQHQLKQDYDCKTVVVSHHGPHALSVHPRYAGDASNASFVSDLSDLLQLPGADLWIHGHVHDSFDYKVGRCRVVANPLGYPLNRDGIEDVRGLGFENKAFRWACVVEV
jgi:predicted phosphodiesterase